MSNVSKMDVSPGRGLFVATAGASITLGDVLSYDLSVSGDAKYYTVVPADTDSADKTAPAGVALATAASGSEVPVCYWGHVDSVNVTGSCVDGTTLFIGATAGQAGDASVGSRAAIGTATSADTSNIASAWIYIFRPV